MSSPPRVAVVIPTHRRVDRLRRLLQGLSLQDMEPGTWEAVIVDDASGADLAPLIDAVAAEVPFRTRVIHQPRNTGPAAARNTGWRATKAEIVAFVDDDCVPGPNWLTSGVEAFADPAMGVVQGPTIRSADGDRYEYTPFTVVREVLAPSPWFEGCNIFYRRDALDQASGFDENAADYLEDTRLGWAVIHHGWTRGWAPQALVEHEIGERSWSWHLWFHWKEGGLVKLGVDYPAVRQSFWRPWAVKPENALFAMAAAGTLLSRRWPPALSAALPYLWWLGPGRKTGAQGAALQVCAHAASLTSKLWAGARRGTFLL